MLPLYDENPTRIFPLVTVLLIAANVAVFIYQLILPSPQALEGFVRAAAVIPYDVTHNLDLRVSLTLFTSLFVHGGWLHIIGNMLYLWIFGNNVEDAMGHLRFTLFYFLCGLGASAAQIAVNINSPVPNIGASGAIAGVLGAYLILFPRARVVSLVTLGYFVRLVRVPAVLVLGFWIVVQLFSGLASLGMPGIGGVAWFAHLGGFLMGLLLVRLFVRGRAWYRGGTFPMGSYRD
ncbi:MAG: rhomboid family intramembrane serine protease [Anaerolineae bacterium]